MEGFLDGTDANMRRLANLEKYVTSVVKNN